jgi:16S rRNA (uracil1498-N3)-methyltransferase
MGRDLQLDSDAARHLSTVLRMREGERLCLFHDGVEGEAIISALSKRGVTVSILSSNEVNRESPLHIMLAQGISRGDRMDYTIQKAVELGVTAIAPIITERTAVKLDAERSNKRSAHWRGIIISACEQCGRTTLPTLYPVTTLSSWLVERTNGSRLLLRGNAQHSLNSLVLEGYITILIGPEGGLSDAECAAAEAVGYTAVRMGPRILRTETAALAALAIIQSRHGDW